MKRRRRTGHVGSWFHSRTGCCSFSSTTASNSLREEKAQNWVQIDEGHNKCKLPLPWQFHLMTFFHVLRKNRHYKPSKIVVSHEPCKHCCLRLLSTRFLGFTLHYLFLTNTTRFDAMWTWWTWHDNGHSDVASAAFFKITKAALQTHKIIAGVQFFHGKLVGVGGMHN